MSHCHRFGLCFVVVVVLKVGFSPRMPGAAAFSPGAQFRRAQGEGPKNRVGDVGSISDDVLCECRCPLIRF